MAWSRASGSPACPYLYGRQILLDSGAPVWCRAALRRTLLAFRGTLLVCLARSPSAAERTERTANDFCAPPARRTGRTKCSTLKNTTRCLKTLTPSNCSMHSQGSRQLRGIAQ